MTAPDDPTVSQADTRASPTNPGVLSEIDEALLRRALKERMFGTGAAVTIGRYEVVRRIGQGGMGVVYEAIDRELERRVAIKLLLPGRAEGRERMVREAKALARLAHPNVVTVHEVGTHEGSVFLAMELVEGVTLGRWLAGAPTRAQILDAFLQAARGLDAAHHAGLVHRDFKPDNVLVAPQGAHGEFRVRVLDFGLVKDSGVEDRRRELGDDLARLEVAQSLTQTGQMVGTPAYMAPEQILDRDVDARADVFAFCVALHEAFAGTRPFSGDSVIALYKATQTAPSRLPGVPPVLSKAIADGLAHAPVDRASSLAPLIDALTPEVPKLRPLRRSAILVAVAVAVAAPVAMLRGWAERDDTARTMTRIDVLDELAPPLPDVTLVVDPNAPRPTSALDSPFCAPTGEPTRSCDELATSLAADDPDIATRCELAQHCIGTVACAPGRRSEGTAGCVPERDCTVSDTAADDACRAGDAACCWSRAREAGVRAYQGRRAGDAMGSAHAMRAAAHSYELGCGAGDSASCVAAGDIAHNEAPAKALQWFAKACAHGHLQACRRIARVGETPERDPVVLQDAIRCANQISDQCAPAGRSRALLTRMAECGSHVFEEPAVVYSPERTERIIFGYAESGLLSEEELAQLPTAEQRFRDEVEAEKRAIFFALGGSRTELARAEPDEMRTALETLAAKRDDQHARELGVMQRVADERAGFAVAPTTTEGMDPYERWLRFSTGLGDRLERAVAAEIGAEKAAALHRLHGRWQASMSVTAGGGGSCPGDRFD